MYRTPVSLFIYLIKNIGRLIPSRTRFISFLTLMIMEIYYRNLQWNIFVSVEWNGIKRSVEIALRFCDILFCMRYQPIFKGSSFVSFGRGWWPFLAHFGNSSNFIKSKFRRKCFKNAFIIFKVINKYLGSNGFEKPGIFVD